MVDVGHGRGRPAVVEDVGDLVTVEAGDSLWTLAQRVAPEHDPRDVVAQIRDLNDLPGAGLVPGQQLVLPVAA